MCSLCAKRKKAQSMLYVCQCIVCLLVLVTLVQCVVFFPVTNGNELYFCCLTCAANSPENEKIYMHKIYLLTRNTILIVMKNKTNSVDKTCIHLINKAVEVNSRDSCLFRRLQFFMLGRIFLLLVRDDTSCHW